ncbi:probable polygalacturonase At3g15720 [Eucalyptus grandis]|uniref:probable polygalacturonase At3g15720 n=1 Tax=Eucalyptus grandis TaxID=71139 RepID=UPI00192E9901|nr:probable polygalacturonase At3g15720 [Eucalyptus grandis]
MHLVCTNPFKTRARETGDLAAQHCWVSGYYNNENFGFLISICSLILVSALLLTSEIKVGIADKTFSISDYGAVGNGLIDDSMVSGEIIAPADPDAWKGKDKGLTFKSVDGLTISGPGSFDANGPAWWNISCQLSPKPAPEWSPNTDGIHIGGSHGVSVRVSIIGTGDDCFSISDQTSNISISDIKCGPSHGVSIGSLRKDGTEVSVSNICEDL